MSSVDWESKFNAIFRDTVHNLDRVKVKGGIYSAYHVFKSCTSEKVPDVLL